MINSISDTSSGSNLLAHKLHHRKIVWMHYANFFVGVWLITNPDTFEYKEQVLSLNSIICGILICVFSLLSVNPMRLWAPWGSVFTGLWLNVSPLLFWATEPEVYSNDILLGTLVMVFALVAPGVPGYKLYETPGPDIPPGWTVNPSSWQQRIPILTIGWLGFFASRYLAAYQLGYKSEMNDPFFGKGTENVLNSDVSKAWPVSDAGLGAFSYLLDAMMGYLGGENRWRTLPWVVILFGILIIPLGAVSLGLIILQPVSVGYWCSLCLFTAVAMLIMIPCTFDEVFASIYLLQESRKQGKPFWRTFFFGDTMTGDSKEFVRHDLTKPFSSLLKEIFRDFTVPWNLLLSSFIGVWLMFSPWFFGYEKSLADSDHTVGALVISFSVIAMGEIVRVVRFVNTLLGLWVILAPLLVLGLPSGIGLYNELACGLLIILFSIRKGRVTNSYGRYDKYVV
jgi:hypothetical protein